MQRFFRNREHAGRVLGEALQLYAGRSDLLVLALPRGGLPVGLEVARRLKAPLDLIAVRKLGVPGEEELAMGAIAVGGERVLNAVVVRALGLSSEVIEAATERAAAELRHREQLYRGDRPRPQWRDRCVILVDDGLATGSTMFAAVRAVRQGAPSSVVVAAPVAPPDTCRQLRREVDDVVCVHAPPMFMAVGQWYEDFPQITDEQVQQLLQIAWDELPGPSAPPDAPEPVSHSRRHAVKPSPAEAE